MSKVNQLNDDAKEKFEAGLQEQSQAQVELKKQHEKYAKKLENLSKKDPFPQAKVDKLKEDIRIEMHENFSPRKGNRTSKVAGVVNSETSKMEGDTDEDLDAAGEKNTQLKELIKKINQMNDKIPKKFEKFQQDIDDKQKVSDAKMKQMLKSATDKLTKGASK